MMPPMLRDAGSGRVLTPPALAITSISARMVGFCLAGKGYADVAGSDAGNKRRRLIDRAGTQP